MNRRRRRRQRRRRLNRGKKTIKYKCHDSCLIRTNRMWHSQNFPGCQFDWLAFANDDILYYNSLHRQLLVSTFFFFALSLCARLRSIIIYLSIGGRNCWKTFSIHFSRISVAFGCYSVHTHHSHTISLSSSLSISSVKQPTNIFRENTTCLSSSAEILLHTYTLCVKNKCVNMLVCWVHDDDE